jgi:hypothetical protein
MVVAIAVGACGSSTSGAAPAADAGGGGDDAGGDASACVDTGQHPVARGETMGIADTKRGRIVFFGGDTGVPIQCNPAPKPNGELWTFDVTCNSFTKVDFTDGPGGRTRGVAVYDPDGDRMIVFGGRYRATPTGTYTVYNEVWALDLTMLTWSKVATTGTSPSARSSTAAVYNPNTKEMIVFGGNTSASGLSFSPLNDVWALNLATNAWRSVATTGTAPAARLFHTAAIDAASSRLYVYGGGDANAFQGPFLRDLWSLDLASGAWTQEDAGTASSPNARINATSMFDAKSKRFLIFGGHDDGSVGNNNDTWAFDPSSKAWTVIVPPETLKTMPPSFCLFPPDFTTPNLAAPDRREFHLAVLDETKGVWTIYGGATDCGLIDDVWTFDVAKGTWSRSVKAKTGEACVRGDNPMQCTTLCN